MGTYGNLLWWVSSRFPAKSPNKQYFKQCNKVSLELEIPLIWSFFAGSYLAALSLMDHTIVATTGKPRFKILTQVLSFYHFCAYTPSNQGQKAMIYCILQAIPECMMQKIVLNIKIRTQACFVKAAEMIEYLFMFYLEIEKFFSVLHLSS